MNPNTILKAFFNLMWRSLPARLHGKLLPHLVAGADPVAKLRSGIPTLEGALRNMRQAGFQPTTVIDCGAYEGEWSLTAAQVFPQARYLLIDGNPENAIAIGNAAAQCGRGSEAGILLLGPREEDGVVFHQMGTGSSVYAELTGFGRRQMELPMRTLDSYVDQRNIGTPVLLKLDVQGFELEVLKGARKTLQAATVVVLETALLPFNKGAPLFAEVVAFLGTAGFVVYDFCGQFRRQTDHALFQTDVIFARTDSGLRAQRKFWLNEP